jgi:hypothetical protein
MKWLEIIELRSVDSNRELLKRQLKALIDEAHKKAEQQAIKVYNHVAIDTDFSIHLLYDSVKADINGSPLFSKSRYQRQPFGFTTCINSEKVRTCKS